MTTPLVTVSAQDRVVGGLSLAAGPLLVAALLAAFKKPKASAVVAGLGVVGGVLGAVAPQWFMGPPAPSPLASKGWADGLPSWSGVLAAVKGNSDLNAQLVAEGGSAYSADAFTYNEPIAVSRTQTSARGSVLDSGQKLSGVGGFWGTR